MFSDHKNLISRSELATKNKLQTVYIFSHVVHIYYSFTFNDIITTSNGNQLSLTANPARISTSDGSPVGTLKVSETAIYTAQFIINATAYNAEFIANTVTVTADAIGQSGNVSDTSDDGDDTDGNTENDPTITVMTPQSAVEVTKTFTVIDDGNSDITVGDIVRFNIAVENTGNAPLSGLTIQDVLKDGNGNVLPMTDGPYYVSGTLSSTVGNLKIGEVATYVAFDVIVYSLRANVFQCVNFLMGPMIVRLVLYLFKDTF